jgi:hypothetical protein
MECPVFQNFKKMTEKFQSLTGKLTWNHYAELLRITIEPQVMLTLNLWQNEDN